MLQIALTGQFLHTYSWLCQIPKNELIGLVETGLFMGWVQFLLPREQDNSSNTGIYIICVYTAHSRVCGCACVCDLCL